MGIGSVGCGIWGVSKWEFQNEKKAVPIPNMERFSKWSKGEPSVPVG
jgi:hypothetical protein